MVILKVDGVHDNDSMIFRTYTYWMLAAKQGSIRRLCYTLPLGSLHS